MSGRPLRDAAGRPAAVAVSRDITAEHAQRTELETFAAVAAHDLSTPLAIIRGYLDVLADLVLPELTGDNADAAADVLRRAEDGTVRMGPLIDDLLHSPPATPRSSSRTSTYARGPTRSSSSAPSTCHRAHRRR